MSYYIARNKERIGPFSEDQLKGMLSSGIISKDDIICDENQVEFTLVHKLLERSEQPQIQEKLEPDSIAPVAHSESAAVLGPKGAGGWLGFFCFSLMILSPLFSLGRIPGYWQRAAEIVSEYPSYKIVLVIATIQIAAIVVVGVYVGYSIWVENRNGKIRAKNYLIFRLVSSIGAGLISYIIIKGSLPIGYVEVFEASLIVSLIFEIVFFFVWWFYFKISKRVKNTFLA